MADRKILLSVGTFLAGFCVSAAALGLLVRDPMALHADMRSEKIALMGQWHGRADAAVFGSSHVHNGFDPRAFDATLDSTPLAEKTLNLGVEGGAQTEQHEMALRFVRQLAPPQGLPNQPLVLLELNAGANLTNDHLVHPRSINLYDLPTTHFAWSLATPAMGTVQMWGRRGYALAALGLHMANFGMISSGIFSAPMDDKQLADETANDRRGLLVPERPASRQAVMEAAIQKFSAAPMKTEKGQLVPGFALMAEDLQRGSAQPGLQVAYLVTPKLSDMQKREVWPPCLMTANGPVAILALNRPDLYPELYQDASNWTDDAHLTEQGAAILSRHAAEQWIAWNQSGKAAANAGCGA